MKTEWIALVAGVGLSAAGMLWLIETPAECPDMLTVAELVDECFQGDEGACRVLDSTVTSSCLLRRSTEATAAKKSAFSKRVEAEVAL